MTTFIDFTPSPIQAFQFQATLDGSPYNVVVTWSFFGARFYVNIYSVDGTLIVSRALIGSANGLQIQSLSWARSKVTATALSPHGLRIGRSIPLVIANAVPAAYNGQFQAYVTGPTTFTYPLAADPGSPSSFGTASYDVSMTAGYFASRLVYRAPNQQFEVSP